MKTIILLLLCILSVSITYANVNYYGDQVMMQQIQSKQQELQTEQQRQDAQINRMRQQEQRQQFQRMPRENDRPVPKPFDQTEQRYFPK
jgi:hypothetical protein